MFENIYYDGLAIGLSVFLITGLFHPVVIKAEYYFTVRIWPVFLLAGILITLFSLISVNPVVRAVLGVTGFTCFWSILELFHQKERVAKGWFPENPKRRKSSEISTRPE